MKKEKFEKKMKSLYNSLVFIIYILDISESFLIHIEPRTYLRSNFLTKSSIEGIQPSQNIRSLLLNSRLKAKSIFALQALQSPTTSPAPKSTANKDNKASGLFSGLAGRHIFSELVMK